MKPVFILHTKIDIWVFAGALTLLLSFASGCFLLDGSLQRSKLYVILAVDRPAYFDVGQDGAPGNQVGTIEKRAGDTLTTLGRYSGGIWLPYYLVLVNGIERYIFRESIFTPDDQIYRRLAPKFTLPPSADRDAWRRASMYLENLTKEDIEIASDNLIKTNDRPDTTAVDYILTRVVQGAQVEYEIICKSLLSDFDPIAEATHLAFYMVTGRIYKYED